MDQFVYVMGFAGFSLLQGKWLEGSLFCVNVHWSSNDLMHGYAQCLLFGYRSYDLVTGGVIVLC